MFKQRTLSQAIFTGLLLSSGAVTLPLLAEERDLKEYKTVDQAVKLKGVAGAGSSQSGKIGIRFDWKQADGPVIAEVESKSPGEKAGLRKGDLVEQINGVKIASREVLSQVQGGIEQGQSLKIQIKREGKGQEVKVEAGAWSNPYTTRPQVRLGLFFQAGKEEGTLVIRGVAPGGPGEKAGVKNGDQIVAVDGKKLTLTPGASLPLDDKKPGDLIKLSLLREGKAVTAEIKAELDQGDEKGGRGWNDRERRLFKKPAYNLAILTVEFADQAMNEKIKAADWEKQLFSASAYAEKNATGQKVYGSMNDYYLEQSCGKMKVEGKTFPPVKLEKKRMEYASATQRGGFLDKIMEKWTARDGDKVMEEFDGVFLLYAGGRAPVSRGNILWPHRAMLTHKGKRFSYFVCPEGGERMANISVMTHEFGHMLGLPDLYARPEVPDMEGLGLWCTMANGHGNEGRPVHFSAWCKEQLGWINPVVISPDVPQKLILSPIESSFKECFKIPVRADGTEYFLLENRAKKGFDKNLPADGLLIWRVVDGKPSLEESHGIAGPSGPSRYLNVVPFPSKANADFTPRTIPSSNPIKQGGQAVHITHIERLPDGRVIFQVGYEYY